MKDIQLNIFLNSNGVIKGSFFEILFYQTQISNTKMDRIFNFENLQVNVSLNTNSGIEEYKENIVKSCRASDINILIHDDTKSNNLDLISDQLNEIVGPIRDYKTTCLILLNVVPENAQYVEKSLPFPDIKVIAAHYGALYLKLDLSNDPSPKEIDYIWKTAIEFYFKVYKYPVFYIIDQEEILVKQLNKLLTRNEIEKKLAPSFSLLNWKQIEKISKLSLKNSSRKQIFKIQPLKIELTNLEINKPSNCQFTITNTSKNVVSWKILLKPESIQYDHFISLTEISGTLKKGKSITITITVVFFNPHELSDFLLIETSIENLCSFLFYSFIAPIQPKPKLPYWDISLSSLVLGTKFYSSESFMVSTATLYGITVAIKIWTVTKNETVYSNFHQEWNQYVNLRHPNIAVLIGGSCESDCVFIVTEYQKLGKFLFYCFFKLIFCRNSFKLSSTTNALWNTQKF